MFSLSSARLTQVNVGAAKNKHCCTLSCEHQDGVLIVVLLLLLMFFLAPYVFTCCGSVCLRIHCTYFCIIFCFMFIINDGLTGLYLT